MINMNLTSGQKIIMTDVSGKATEYTVIRERKYAERLQKTVDTV